MTIRPIREPSDPLTITASPAAIAPRTFGSSAAESFAQEVKLNRNAVSLHFLANSLHHSGKIKESIPYYIDATRVNPKNESVFVDLANAYHDLGQNAEAVAVFDWAIRLDPDDEKARAFLGVTQFEMGNLDGARQQYQWLLKANPRLAAELLRSYNKLSGDVRKVEELKSAGN